MFELIIVSIMFAMVVGCGCFGTAYIISELYIIGCEARRLNNVKEKE